MSDQEYEDIEIEVTEEEYALLTQWAEEQNITISELVNNLLTSYMNYVEYLEIKDDERTSAETSPE